MAERARAKTKAKDKSKTKNKGRQASRGKVAKAAGAGHNGPVGMTDDEAKVEMNRLNRLYADWEKDNEVAKQSKGVYSSARKAAKKKGLNIDAYTQARDLDRQDHGKVIVDAADTGRYLRIMKSPLATQMELFQNLTVPEPVVDVALQGQNAGKAGEPSDNNPFVPGSDDYSVWAENHALGAQKATEAFRTGVSVN